MLTLLNIAVVVTAIVLGYVPTLRRPVFVTSVILLCIHEFLLQLIRYGLVSLAGMCIAFGIYTSLILYSDTGFVTATFYSGCAACSFKIVVQRIWVFRRRNDSIPLIAAQVSLLTYKYLHFWIANIAVLQILIEHYSFGKIWAQAMAIPMLGFLSFLISLSILRR